MLRFAIATLAVASPPWGILAQEATNALKVRLVVESAETDEFENEQLFDAATVLLTAKLPDADLDPDRAERGPSSNDELDQPAQRQSRSSGASPMELARTDGARRHVAALATETRLSHDPRRQGPLWSERSGGLRAAQPGFRR